VQSPAPNSDTDSLARLEANGREKTDKVIPCAAHSSPGPKVKSKEVKAFLQVITCPIVILAIDVDYSFDKSQYISISMVIDILIGAKIPVFQSKPGIEEGRIKCLVPRR
jgi:hypothetical protein